MSRIYYWYDERGKKTKCTAPQYVDFVMSLVQKLVTDDDIFPTKYGECKALVHTRSATLWSVCSTAASPWFSDIKLKLGL